MKNTTLSILNDDLVIKQHILKSYKEILCKEPTQENLDLYFQKIKNGEISFEGLHNYLKGSVEKKQSIKQITQNFSLPTEEIFALIYQNKLWNKFSSTGTGISSSGSGSNLEQTESIRTELPKLLKELKISSMLDIPCGDFLWMKEIDLGFISYLGGDIVSEIIEMNNKKYSDYNRKFSKINIINDPLPKTDLILCRYLLQHFSFSDIWKSINNIKKSKSKYLLTTTQVDVKNNNNIPTGSFNPLNLLLPPFLFPPPIRIINEKCTVPNFEDVCLLLWKISDL